MTAPSHCCLLGGASAVQGMIHACGFGLRMVALATFSGWLWTVFPAHRFGSNSNYVEVAKHKSSETCLLFMFSSIEAMHWFSVSKKNCQSLLYTLYAASPNLAAFFRCFAKNSSKIPSRTNRCEKCATYASCTLKSNAIILLKRRFFVIAKERCEELALHAANEGRALHWNRKRKTH